MVEGEGMVYLKEVISLIDERIKQWENRSERAKDDCQQDPRWVKQYCRRKIEEDNCIKQMIMDEFS